MPEILFILEKKLFLCIIILYKYLGVAQFGSALEWGSRGREFKSPHSDHDEKA